MCVTLAIGIPLLMGKVGGFDAVAQLVPSGHYFGSGILPGDIHPNDALLTAVTIFAFFVKDALKIFRGDQRRETRR
jgi:hypothetical protein